MKQQKITTISNLPLAKGYMCVLTKNKKVTCSKLYSINHTHTKYYIQTHGKSPYISSTKVLNYVDTGQETTTITTCE